MLQMNLSNLMVSHKKLRVEDATSARKRTTSNTANEFRKGSVEIFVRKKSSPAESKKKQKKKTKTKTKQIVILATASVVTQDYLNLTIAFIKVLLK